MEFIHKIRFVSCNGDPLQSIVFDSKKSTKDLSKLKVVTNKLPFNNPAEKKISNLFDQLVEESSNITLSFDPSLFEQYIDIKIPSFLTTLELIEIIACITRLHPKNFYVISQGKNMSYISMDDKFFAQKISLCRLLPTNYDNKSIIINIGAFIPCHTIMEDNTIDIVAYPQNLDDKEFDIFPDKPSLLPWTQDQRTMSLISCIKSLKLKEIKDIPSFKILKYGRIVDIKKSIIYEKDVKVNNDVINAWKRIYKDFFNSRIICNDNVNYTISYNDKWLINSINELEMSDFIIKSYKDENRNKLYVDLKNVDRNTIRLILDPLNGFYMAESTNDSLQFNSFNELKQNINIYKDILSFYIKEQSKSINTDFTIRKTFEKNHADIKELKPLFNQLFTQGQDEVGKTSAIYILRNDLTRYLFCDLYRDLRDSVILNGFQFYLANHDFQSYENDRFAKLKIKQFENFVEFELRGISTERYALLLINFITGIMLGLGYIESNNETSISTKGNMIALINNDPKMFGNETKNRENRYSRACQSSDKQPTLSSRPCATSLTINNQSKEGKKDIYICKDSKYKYIKYVNQKGRCTICCSIQQVPINTFEQFYCHWKLTGEKDPEIEKMLGSIKTQIPTDFSDTISPGKLCKLSPQMKIKFGNDINLFALSILSVEQPISYNAIIDYLKRPIFVDIEEANVILIDEERTYVRSYNNKKKSIIAYRFPTNTFILVYQDKDGYRPALFNLAQINQISTIPLSNKWCEDNNISIPMNIDSLKLLHSASNETVEVLYCKHNTNTCIAIRIGGRIIPVKNISIDTISKILETNAIVYIDNIDCINNSNKRNIDYSSPKVIIDNIRGLLYIIMFISTFVYKISIFDDKFENIIKDNIVSNKNLKYGKYSIYSNGVPNINDFEITKEGLEFIKKKIVFDELEFLDNDNLELYLKLSIFNELS